MKIIRQLTQRVHSWLGPDHTAIAEILSDMDTEIAKLDKKLVKARQVKAGMMSELPSGKIRLVGSGK